MHWSRYGVKGAILAPRTAHRRRRARALDPTARQLLETQRFGSPMYRFMEAMAENPDLLTDVEIGPGGVALDVGAFVGDWSLRMSERHDCAVYAFEPSPGPSATASSRLARRRGVEVMAVALAAADGRARLARDGPGSSIHGGPARFGTVDVQVRDVAAVLDELHLDRVDVLKVNIEGGEYDLLERLVDTGWLARIGTVSVQFHEWHPGAYRRRRRLRAALRRSHRELWTYPWVWELWEAR